MSTDKATKPESPRTLMQAHTALGVWKAYYEQSVALYREIAEIDRGHHHEALYWAEWEQKSADEIATRISAEKSPVNDIYLMRGWWLSTASSDQGNVMIAQRSTVATSSNRRHSSSPPPRRAGPTQQVIVTQPGAVPHEPRFGSEWRFREARKQPFGSE